jgi:hypothetical protein
LADEGVARGWSCYSFEAKRPFAQLVEVRTGTQGGDPSEPGNPAEAAIERLVSLESQGKLCGQWKCAAALPKERRGFMRP